MRSTMLTVITSLALILFATSAEVKDRIDKLLAIDGKQRLSGSANRYGSQRRSAFSA